MRIRTALFLCAVFFLCAAAISHQAKAAPQSFEACVELSNGNTEALVACYNQAITQRSAEIVQFTSQIKPMLSQPELALLESTGQAYSLLLTTHCPLQGAAHITKEDLAAGIASPEGKLAALDCQLKLLGGAAADMAQLLASLKDSGGHR